MIRKTHVRLPSSEEKWSTSDSSIPVCRTGWIGLCIGSIAKDLPLQHEGVSDKDPMR